MDGVQHKKPTKLSAPEYVDALMGWVQGQLDDETLFPSKIGPRSPHHGFFSICYQAFPFHETSKTS